MQPQVLLQAAAFEAKLTTLPAAIDVTNHSFNNIVG
jgi:hypothetical protein